MKIAIYLDKYRPQDGGAFTIQDDILKAILAFSPKEDFVIVASSSAVLPTQPDIPFVRYDGEKLGDKVRASLVNLFPSLRQKIKIRSYFERLLRANGVQFIWFLSQRPLNVDLPYMTTVWDLQHRKQPWFPEVSEYSEWETRERRLGSFLRRAAIILAGTEAGKNEITSFFQIPPDRVFVLPHPTPSDVLDVAGKHPLPEHLSPGYLFYPAQFWAHKNHANLLLALKQLRDHGKIVQLVLTGADFGNKRHVDSLINELGLGDQVKILGFVERNTLIALYQNALALTYVSFFGPENLPPLEAFALNCPVIAGNVDGAKEQFGDAAILVDPASPDEIANAIVQILEEPNRRADLVAKGRLRAAKWTAHDFVAQATQIMARFAAIRRTWDT
jgi:glycosyltransferase involved in cell wall biosynthesis